MLCVLVYFALAIVGKEAVRWRKFHLTKAKTGIAMNSVPKISKWEEGQVDRTKEHFELRYESTVKFESDWSDWIPVAAVGPPIAGVVNVHFLVDPADPKNEGD